MAIGDIVSNPLPVVLVDPITFGIMRASGSTAAGITPAGNVATNADSVPVQTTASVIPNVVYSYRFNGTSWDRDRKTNIIKRVVSSAASGNPDFLKASPGDLTLFWGVNGASITYLQIYNKASAPVIGTDTPAATYPIPANSNFTQSIGGGFYHSTGIAFAFTTDAAGTTGAAAAAVTSFCMFGS